jgi:hypothetical protein
LLISGRFVFVTNTPWEHHLDEPSPPERIAFCGLSFPDGTGGIYTIPLSDAEIAAWKQHPETFSGEVGKSKRI